MELISVSHEKSLVYQQFYFFLGKRTISVPSSDNNYYILANYCNNHNSGRNSIHRNSICIAEFCCHQLHWAERKSFGGENLDFSTMSKSSHFIFAVKSSLRRFQEILMHLQRICNYEPKKSDLRPRFQSPASSNDLLKSSPTVIRLHFTGDAKISTRQNFNVATHFNLVETRVGT